MASDPLRALIAGDEQPAPVQKNTRVTPAQQQARDAEIPFILQTRSTARCLLISHPIP